MECMISPQCNKSKRYSDKLSATKQWNKISAALKRKFQEQTFRNKQSNYKHSENKHSNNKHSGNPNPGKSKTANSTHTKQKPTSKECSFCKTKGYTYGNRKDDECGRKDNPKNAPNSRSDSSSSNQTMALLKEMRELKTVVDNMKAAFYDDDEAIPHVNAAMR
ncbi:unnamed protein product, partial [Aphanomyces euteiches]